MNVPSRLTSFGRKPRAIGALVIGAGLVVTGLIAVSVGMSGNNLLRHLATESKSSATRPSDARALKKLGLSDSETVVLGVRGDRAYYRVGTDCYAVGPAEPTDYVYGRITCAPEFPSAERPVLDFTTHVTQWDSQRQNRGPTLVSRSEGFAAEGIERVALVAADGRVLAEAPVVKTIYRFTNLPAEEVSTLRAINTAGQTVFSISTSAGDTPRPPTHARR
jgi:hypothetical protein